MTGYPPGALPAAALPGDEGFGTPLWAITGLVLLPGTWPPLLRRGES